MSSKLVKGGSPDAGEIVWRAVGPPPIHNAPQPFAPPAGIPGGSVRDEDQQTAELKRQLHACQQQIESRAQESYQKGLQQGEANARQQLGAQQDVSLQRLARTIEEISGMRQRCRCEAEQDVVHLALAIARRIVHRELTIDPSTILGLVKAALAGMDVRELHRIRIHPGQADPLRLQLEAIGLPQRCEVQADPSLERGAAILETSHGNLDASVETQFEEIERGFADLVRHTI